VSKQQGDAVNKQTLPESCPLPVTGTGDRILLAHGEGGRLTRRLIAEHVLPAVGNEYLAQLGDAAQLPRVDGPLAMTTDSFVVSPLFFPGGDIGSLAVYGTVNDLTVAGARPRWISLGMIIEEGLAVEELGRVLASVAAAAQRVGVSVVTGDTKVVPRGAADGLFLNTTGVGQLIEPVPPGPAEIQSDDVLLVTGPIGCHGMAVMSVRQELDFDPPPVSDSAPLLAAVEALRTSGTMKHVRAMRDATRGGVAAVLHEWAGACGLTLCIAESQLPVTDQVRGACELLGLDPIHVACEGTMVLAVDTAAADEVVAALQSVPETHEVVRIGAAQSRGLAPVVISRALGSEQPLDEPLGAPLPRIC